MVFFQLRGAPGRAGPGFRKQVLRVHDLSGECLPVSRAPHPRPGSCTRSQLPALPWRLPCSRPSPEVPPQFSGSPGAGGAAFPLGLRSSPPASGAASPALSHLLSGGEHLLPVVFLLHEPRSVFPSAQPRGFPFGFSWDPLCPTRQHFLCNGPASRHLQVSSGCASPLSGAGFPGGSAARAQVHTLDKSTPSALPLPAGHAQSPASPRRFQSAFRAQTPPRLCVSCWGSPRPNRASFPMVSPEVGDAPSTRESQTEVLRSVSPYSSLPKPPAWP